MKTPANAYDALAQTAALFDRSDRGRLAVSGPDRARFLHNLTTNDVKRLPVGGGQEAFVTSLQGKTLGYLIVLAEDDRILLRSDPGALVSLLPHLEKYGLFDDVALDDQSGTTFEFHVAGPAAEELIRGLAPALPDAKELAHCASRLEDVALRIIRENPTGRPGLTLIGEMGSVQAVWNTLHAAGAAVGLVDGDAATFEVARIEAGTPRFGHDVTPDNLPQEVGRDCPRDQLCERVLPRPGDRGPDRRPGPREQASQGAQTPGGRLYRRSARPSRPPARPPVWSPRLPARPAGHSRLPWAISRAPTPRREPRS